MMVGLIETGLIGLTYWAPLVHGRAVYAQSSVRRFARCLIMSGSSFLSVRSLLRNSCVAAAT